MHLSSRVMSYELVAAPPTKKEEDKRWETVIKKLDNILNDTTLTDTQKFVTLVNHDFVSTWEYRFNRSSDSQTFAQHKSKRIKKLIFGNDGKTLKEETLRQFFIDRLRFRRGKSITPREEIEEIDALLKLLRDDISKTSTRRDKPGEENRWSTACKGVADFDEHLKTLGINRETNPATDDYFQKIKKKRSRMVHPDKCPNNLMKEWPDEDKRWFKEQFQEDVKDVVEGGKDCNPFMQKVNNAIDEINQCRLKK